MMGNLTRDPDLKNLASGQAVCRLSVASNRQFKNRQNGQLFKEVCFLDVDVWGVQAESCSKFLVKGRPVLIEGRLKFDTWEDQDGKKQSKHSIVADRVTFLTGGAGAEVEEGDSSMGSAASTETRFEAAKPAPRSFAPKRPAAAAGSKLKLDTGEINFKDEKAFDDELPF